MNLKLYVSVKRNEESRKLVVMMNEAETIASLKRHIESNYSQLFPNDTVFICQKLEDRFGYALSNTSDVGELLHHEDRVVAIGQGTGNMVSASTDFDLISLLINMQENIVTKLSQAQITLPLDVLSEIIPLTFSSTQEIAANAGVIIAKTLEENPQILEGNKRLSKFLALGLSSWVDEYLGKAPEIADSLMRIISNLSDNRAFCMYFKSPQLSQKLMNLKLDTRNRGKVVKILSVLGDGRVQDNMETAKSYQDHANMKKSATRRPMDELDMEDTSAIQDAINIFSSNSSSDIIDFALETLISDKNLAVNVALSSPSLVSNMFNLVELNPSRADWQIELLSRLCNKLTTKRAEDLIRQNAVTRLINAYRTQTPNMQEVIMKLLERIMKEGRDILTLSMLIGVCKSPHEAIGEIGIQTLMFLINEYSDSELEVNIRFIIRSCNAGGISTEFRNNCIECLAELCKRNGLVNQIVNYGGVEQLLKLVTDDANLPGQRLAARALANLCAGREDIGVTVVSRLAPEINKMYKNQLDGIVAAYLQNLLQRKT